MYITACIYRMNMIYVATMASCMGISYNNSEYLICMHMYGYKIKLASYLSLLV